MRHRVTGPLRFRFEGLDLPSANARSASEGFYCRYERHYVYWRVLSDGAFGIVTLLHERMHQIGSFRVRGWAVNGHQ